MPLLATGASFNNVYKNQETYHTHSLGEYAALVVAGVLGLDDALRLVAGRAQLMGLKCVSNETGMLAVKLSPAELQRHIASNSEYDQLSIACYNRCALPSFSLFP